MTARPEAEQASALDNGGSQHVEPPATDLLPTQLDGRHASVPCLPDVTDMTTAQAAEAYARAGIAIVPVPPGTKNPGGYIGKGWQRRATWDVATIRDWWRRWPSAGIAMHVGGSGLLVVDVDEDVMPAWLAKLLQGAGYRPTTNNPGSQRGHYFFRCIPDERFGCGLGKLKAAKAGATKRDVKGWGGAVMLGPSVHPRKDEGGHYGTNAVEIPLRPDELVELLNSAADSDAPHRFTPGRLDEFVRKFLDTYSDEREPKRLDAILADFDPEPGCRHSSMFSCLCWAAREAKAGCFGAVRAIGELRKRWEQAIGGAYRHDDPAEFDRMVRDALFAADADGTPQELWDRAHRHIWPEPDDPRPVGLRVIQLAEARRAPLRYWNGLWFCWTGTHYRRFMVEDLRDDLYDLLEEAYYQTSDGRLHKWKPANYKLDRVIDAMRGRVKVPIDTQTPVWLNGVSSDRVVPCANGLLRLSDRTLLEHTPDYFNLFALQYDYDPEAMCPRWRRFLNQVFDDDTEAIELLQDWFYYVLTGRTDLQVMLLWIGPKRGGKGTVARVLKRLIGPDAYASLTIDNIKQRFGLQEHIHKSLGVFPDERHIGAPDGKQLVSFILKVTGEDDVPIDIKHRPPWNGRLPMRAMYMGNIMPVLPDSAGAIGSRLLPINTTASFAGKEDRDLEGALTQELPGILNWALDAKLAHLRSGFVIPTSSAALLDDIDDYSNPIRQFLRDSCILEEGQRVECRELFTTFDRWRRSSAITAYGDSRWFGRELTAAMRDLAPDVRFERKQPPGTGRKWHYLGVGLRHPSSGPRVIVNRSDQEF